jgi:Arc/MetJ family transcription regulator
VRTTLNLDRDLLEEAREILGAGSLTETIEVALKRVVAEGRARRAWEELLESDLSWDSVEDLLHHRRSLGGRTP